MNLSERQKLSVKHEASEPEGQGPAGSDQGPRLACCAPPPGANQDRAAGPYSSALATPPGLCNKLRLLRSRPCSLRSFSFGRQFWSLSREALQAWFVVFAIKMHCSVKPFVVAPHLVESIQPRK